MEFTTKRSDLERQLGFVRFILPTKAKRPVLSCVLIETTDAGIRITGTDLDVTLRSTVAATIKRPGNVVVNGRKLYDVIHQMGAEAVRFSLGPNGLTLACGRSHIRLSTLPAEDFPRVNVPSLRNKVRVSALTLKRMARQTIFTSAPETDSSRHNLCGVKIEISPERLRMVATDGHRLAISDGEVITNKSDAVVVPRRAMSCLVRLVELGEILLGIGEHHVYFTAEGRELISSDLPGKFPNYDLVIPDNSTRKAYIEVGPLTDAIRRVAIMTYDKEQFVRLHFRPGELEVMDFYRWEDQGACDKIPCELSGEPIEIGFNAGYLLQFLDVVGTDRISMEMSAPDNQAVLKPDGASFDYTYVVMPVRLPYRP